MGVQTFATKRNQDAEFFVSFLLNLFGITLQDDDIIESFVQEAQKRHQSAYANDIWDHYLELHTAKSSPLQVWAQTTCYKGSKKKVREPNKTYEIRETLVEALSLRKDLGDKGIPHRILHFTLGDINYTYEWFADAKAATFDLSAYLETDTDIFSLISETLKGCRTEQKKRAALASEYAADSELGNCMRTALSILKTWYTAGARKNHIAEAQASLVDITNDPYATKDIPIGLNIKGRVNFIVHDNSDTVKDDPLIVETTKTQLSKNPFLKTAIDVLSDWNAFVRRIDNLTAKDQSLDQSIIKLWNLDDGFSLITRRLLVRLHSESEINYIQDRDVDGITEHNLYSGEHSAQQIKQLSERIIVDLRVAGISTTDALIEKIKKEGRKRTAEAKWFESQNGTQLRPSFDYALLALRKKGYRNFSPRELEISTIGYHSGFSESKVLGYNNLKVITDSARTPKCILKGKFFNQPEFPRRCKEEAYVGLTITNSFNGKEFSAKTLGLPLVMFIDMASDTKPEKRDIKRLAAFGWTPAFSVDEIINAF